MQPWFRGFFTALAMSMSIAGGMPAVAADVLRIASEGAYPPFNYIDEDGNLAGFDIDISRALCEQMEVECEIVAVEWDTIIQGLLDGEYDAIIASMSITPERQKLVAFTDKYYSTPMRFVGRTNPDGPITIEDLAGKRLGGQAKTTSAAYLTENFPDKADIRLYPTQAEVNEALVDGDIDIMIADSLVAWNFLRTEAGQPFSFVNEPVRVGSDIAIAVRKEDVELRQRLNKALSLLIIDGTYETINLKYFPFSIY